MEVSKETWVCSTDFIRRNSNKRKPPPPPPPVVKTDGEDESKVSTAANAFATVNNVMRAADGGRLPPLQQPAREGSTEARGRSDFERDRWNRETTEGTEGQRLQILIAIRFIFQLQQRRIRPAKRILRRLISWNEHTRFIQEMYPLKLVRLNSEFKQVMVAMYSGVGRITIAIKLKKK
ncbi:hypothetical protein LXL04_038095 [Taraxacum kok-saghyz]